MDEDGWLLDHGPKKLSQVYAHGVCSIAPWSHGFPDCSHIQGTWLDLTPTKKMPNDRGPLLKVTMKIMDPNLDEVVGSKSQGDEENKEYTQSEGDGVQSKSEGDVKSQSQGVEEYKEYTQDEYCHIFDISTTMKQHLPNRWKEDITSRSFPVGLIGLHGRTYTPLAMGWDWETEKFPLYATAGDFPSCQLPKDIDDLILGLQKFEERYVSPGVPESRRQGVKICTTWLQEMKLCS